MTLELLGVGDGLDGPPKLGDAIVFGRPVPDPNEPEHAANPARAHNPKKRTRG